MTPIRPHARARSEINVTPLIDIVLVLLIIFIVMVPSLQSSLSASIPRRTEGPTPPSRDHLVVSLDRSGVLRLQQEVLPLPALADRLLDPLLKQPCMDRRVILRVDEDLPYERAVAVMDCIRGASLKVQRASQVKLGTPGNQAKVVLTTLRAAAQNPA